MKLAEDGDHNNVDLLVRDMAGSSSNYNKVSPDGMVSSFGKAAKCKGSSGKVMKCNVKVQLCKLNMNPVKLVIPLHSLY